MFSKQIIEETTNSSLEKATKNIANEIEARSGAAVISKFLKTLFF